MELFCELTRFQSLPSGVEAAGIKLVHEHRCLFEVQVHCAVPDAQHRELAGQAATLRPGPGAELLEDLWQEMGWLNSE